MIFPGISALVPTEQKPAEEPVTSMRSVTFDLASEQSTTQPQASVTLPEGLLLGKSAKLQASVVTPPSKSSTEPTQGEETKVLMKTYWGSSETVQPNQPSVKQDTSSDAAAVAPALSGRNYRILAQWPGIQSDYGTVMIKPEASAAGTYTLNSNFTTVTSATVDPEQDFLAPVIISGIDKNIDPDKPVSVQWKSVPNALAYLVVAYGGNAKESITWTAGAEAGASLDVESWAMTREQVAKYIEDKVLLPADATSCVIPAKIFKGSTGAMLSITAIGTDKIQEKNGLETQVIVRSMASIPLFSTKYQKVPEPFPAAPK